MTPRTVKHLAKRRTDYTGECYSQAREAILCLAVGSAPIPPAHSDGQVDIECRVFAGVLALAAYGALDGAADCSLAVRSVRPFADRLELRLTDQLAAALCLHVFGFLARDAESLGFAVDGRRDGTLITQRASGAALILRDVSVRQFTTIITPAWFAPGAATRVDHWPADQRQDMSALLRRLHLIRPPAHTLWALGRYSPAAGTVASSGLPSILRAALADARFGCELVFQPPPASHDALAPQLLKSIDSWKLLQQARSGDAAAWDAIVDRYANLVWSVARAHQLDQAAAADASQATWTRLAGELKHIDDLGVWLADVAGRVSRRLLKHSKTRTMPERLTKFIPAKDAQLWHHFRKLPIDDQVLLRVLIADPAPSYAEAAAALQIPARRIGPARRHALAKLRNSLGARAA